MYATFFGLRRRPFSPVPDPACLAAVHSAEAAHSTLRDCLELGRGIAVLTAPAGLGKTLICRRLAAALRERFAVALLPSSPAPTRRALLQAVLYELGHQNVRAEEGELRLRLWTAIEQLPPQRGGLVLILDEAHLVPERLLEELRALTSLSAEGEPLVRLLLSGQLALEEKLASPLLADLSQRIGGHCTLAPLTQEESQRYLAARVAWAGGRVSEIFTPEALRLITRASDGSPRALNQLSEECLLIAARRQERPVREATVRESLRELQQLPQHWNVSFATETDPEDRTAGPVSFDATEASPASRIELGCDEQPSDQDAFEEEIGAVEFGFDETSRSEMLRKPIEVRSTQPSNCAVVLPSDDSRIERTDAAPVAAASAALPCGCRTWNACLCKDELELSANEERVIDRYALLDAGQPAPDAPPAPPRPPIGADGVLPELADLRDEESRMPVIAQSSPASCDREAESETLLIASSSADLTNRRTEGPQRRFQLIDSARTCRLTADDDQETSDTSDDVEMRIGSSVLETCMAAQRAIRERVESLSTADESPEACDPPAETPRPRLHPGSTKRPNARLNGATASHQANEGELGIRRDDAQPHEPRLPRRRFERLFSELRRRSQETESR